MYTSANDRKGKSLCPFVARGKIYTRIWANIFLVILWLSVCTNGQLLEFYFLKMWGTHVDHTIINRHYLQHLTFTSCSMRLSVIKYPQSFRLRTRMFGQFLHSIFSVLSVMYIPEKSRCSRTGTNNCRIAVLFNLFCFFIFWIILLQ